MKDWQEDYTERKKHAKTKQQKIELCACSSIASSEAYLHSNRSDWSCWGLRSVYGVCSLDCWLYLVYCFSWSIFLNLKSTSYFSKSDAIKWRQQYFKGKAPDPFSPSKQMLYGMRISQNFYFNRKGLYTGGIYSLYSFHGEATGQSINQSRYYSN